MFSTDIYHPSLIQNKYFELYKRLIEVDLSDEYMETHHILPRCLGGTDDPSNLKSTTSRIHFLAHYLLTKCVEKDTPSWHKLVNAFNFMKSASGNTSRYFNSRLYESNRKHMSKTMSLLQSGSLNNSFGTMWITDGVVTKKIKKDAVIPEGWFKGRTFNEETQTKLSQYNKNNMWITDGTINKSIKKYAVIPEGWTKGHYTSEEAKEKLRLASTGRTLSEGAKEKLRLANIGRNHSEETKEKMRLSKKKTMLITNGTENKMVKKDVMIPEGFCRGWSSTR